jgi:hypothetical protein
MQASHSAAQKHSILPGFCGWRDDDLPGAARNADLPICCGHFDRSSFLPCLEPANDRANQLL